MDASDPDVAARGRALFEQLRAEREGVVTASSTVGVPLPPEPHSAADQGAPRAGGDSRPPAEPVDIRDGSEIRAETSPEAGSDREPGDSGPAEGGQTEAEPLAAPVSVDAGEQGSPPAGEDSGPAAGGGSPSDGRPLVGSAPTGLADQTEAASPTDSPGEATRAEFGPAEADPDPPPPPAGRADVFHVEHAGSDAESGATTAEPPVPAHAAAPAATSSPPVSEGRVRHPAADLALPRIIAVANQKGGVGKTTTAVNLGAALAELGFRTLVVDLDPQGNATTGLGINARNLDSSIYDVLMHEMPIDECIEPTSVRNLFVAPATIDLAGAEIELVPAFSRELRLKRALAEVADAYEFTIIDCPPSLGLLTVNGLAAATEVIVPIQCEYYALEGLGQLMRNVNLVQSNLNPTLLLSAIILTMYDARTKLADQVASEVRDHFGTRVCRNVVPRTVRLSEAPSFGQPIIVFDPSSRGALAYRELAKEVSGGAPQRVG